jgi:hypothetical protein
MIQQTLTHPLNVPHLCPDRNFSDEPYLTGFNGRKGGGGKGCSFWGLSQAFGIAEAARSHEHLGRMNHNERVGGIFDAVTD